MNVLVIDDSDAPGQVTAMAHAGEISMGSTVRETVDRIIAHIGRKTMSSLTLIDHGDTSPAHWCFQIGTENIGLCNIATHAGQLGRLNGTFKPGGYVRLRACTIGNNIPLLIEVAQIIGVPVYASTGYYSGAIHLQTGQTVRANPDRTFEDARSDIWMDMFESFNRPLINNEA